MPARGAVIADIPIGTRFGRLRVAEQVTSAPDRHARWLCLCDCGQFTVVLKVNLLSGDTKSCGCLHREVCGALARRRNWVGEDAEYGAIHRRAQKALPFECALAGQQNCSGPLEIAFRWNADLDPDLVRTWVNGTPYFVGDDPAVGYLRLCHAHHAKYDRIRRNLKRRRSP
jgi:hypothetical protein